ncbi:MAG: DUF3488 and DUF4129 domain-containing transglutaminase family protein [Phycisphaerales bacterium]
MNSIARRSHGATGVLILLGITAYTTAADAPLFALVGIPIVLVSWRLTRDEEARPHLPRWLVNVLLFAAMGFAAWRGASRGPDVDSVAELVLLLLLIKLGDRRTPRDDAQVVTLAAFLGIAAVLTSSTFWVGIQVIAFIPVLIHAVMLHQLASGVRAARDAARSAGVAAGTVETVGARFASHLRRTTVAALAGTLAAGVGVFLFMPRGIGQDMFGQWVRSKTGAVTGFTDQVRLGSASGVISQSSEVVMDLRVRTRDGVRVGGAEPILYLRGAVLERYEDGVWAAREGATQRDPVPRQAGEPTTFGEDRAAADIVQIITLHNVGEDGVPLFTTWRPLSIDIRTKVKVHVDQSTRTVRMFPMQPRGLPSFEYAVGSASQEPRTIPVRRTRTGFANQRIADLARRVVTDAGEDPDPLTRPVDADGAAARVIQDWLRTSFGYTLTLREAPAGVDPIEHFLFDRREGHCEFFAAAMTAMCRAVGVNARMVVGYVAAEYNPSADVYTVRASNAHAWVEAELGVGRWRRYDPTPSAELTRLHRPAVGLWGRIRQWFDAIEFAWNSSVVSFDEAARSRVLGGGGGPAGGIIASVESLLWRLRAGGPRLFRSAALSGAVVFFGALVLGLTAVALLRRSGRGRGPRRWRWGLRRRAGGRGPDAALAARLARVRFYDRLLNLLSRRGHGKPSWRPPLEHAAIVRPDDAPLADAADTIARIFYAVRFGGRDLSEADERRAEAVLSAASRPRG